MDGSKIITISDKPTASQPSSTASPWAKFLTEMRTYFVSNVMTTAWSVLLFAGGMIFLGIRVKRDSEVSVIHAEGLHAAKSAAPLQSTNRHGIVGQKPAHLHVSL
jgi:hypothetical protein